MRQSPAAVSSCLGGTAKAQPDVFRRRQELFIAQVLERIDGTAGVLPRDVELCMLQRKRFVKEVTALSRGRCFEPIEDLGSLGDSTKPRKSSRAVIQGIGRERCPYKSTAATSGRPAAKSPPSIKRAARASFSDGDSLRPAPAGGKESGDLPEVAGRDGTAG